MKKRFAKLLHCLDCKSNLRLQPFSEKGEEVLEGRLYCTKCKASYPVINSIPRILPEEMMNELVWKKYPSFLKKYKNSFEQPYYEMASTFEKNAKERTSKSFGFEWKEFSEFHPHYRKQFLDWLNPVKPELFRKKLVLDAGCGMGRHLVVAAEYAEEIIGIDFSEAVDAAYKHVGKKKNVHLLQADIYNLPFARDFDIVYSIGVIHHLPKPERGFRALLKHIKKGGKIFVWIYGREGNFVMVKIIEPFRKYFTSKLPHKFLYYLCFPITALLEASAAFYLVANKLPVVNKAAVHLPSNKYLLYIQKFSFRHKLAIVFDFLSAPLARYYRKREFEKWFANANLTPRIYPHNQNSWKGIATVK